MQTGQRSSSLPQEGTTPDFADIEQAFIDAHGIVRSFFELLSAADRGSQLDVRRIGQGGSVAAEAAEKAFYELLRLYLQRDRGDLASVNRP